MPFTIDKIAGKSSLYGNMSYPVLIVLVEYFTLLSIFWVAGRIRYDIQKIQI